MVNKVVLEGLWDACKVRAGIGDMNIYLNCRNLSNALSKRKSTDNSLV